MDSYHERTCVKFVPRTNEGDYAFIQRGGGCKSEVGRLGGAQHITLGDVCWGYGVVLHELMHTVGFHHEHSRADRDKYIREGCKS